MTKDGAESQLLKTLDRLPPERYEASVVLSRAEGERVRDLAALPCVRRSQHSQVKADVRDCSKKRSHSVVLSMPSNPTSCIVGCGIPISSVDSPVDSDCGDRFRISLPNAATTMRGTGSFGFGLQKNSSTIPRDVLLTNSAQIQRHLHSGIQTKTSLASPICWNYPPRRGHNRARVVPKKS